jgi:hypothetical protein
MDKTQQDATSSGGAPKAAAESQRLSYPSGAQVRVGDICRDRKKGRAGLLPINRATWYKWVAAGRVPAGTRIGENTTVWPIEVVLSICAPPAGDTPSSANVPGAPQAIPLKSDGLSPRGPKRGPVAPAGHAESVIA